MSRVLGHAVCPFAILRSFYLSVARSVTLCPFLSLINIVLDSVSLSLSIYTVYIPSRLSMVLRFFCRRSLDPFYMESYAIQNG